LLVAAVAVGWTCAATVSALAGGPGDDLAPRTEEASRAPADTTRATNRAEESREAEVVFHGAARGGKAVSLVVAGTPAPVLCLPVKDDVRVLDGGRPSGIDCLRAGTRVVIRMDSTNGMIQDIRALPRPERAADITRESDLTNVQSPPSEEV